MTRRFSLRSAGWAVLGLALTASAASAQTQTPPAAPAAGKLDLTLEDAVRRAVDHNPDLAVVRLDSNAQSARVAEARGAFVPLFNQRFGRSNSASAPSSFLAGVNGIESRDWFSSTGFSQRLQWGGGTWNASWDAARTSTNSPLNTFDPATQSGLMLAFSQPLFRDRATDSARVQYVITKRDLASSELRFKQSVVQTVASVKQAYWTYKALTANVTVQQRSLDLAQDLVRQNQARVRVGEAPPLDLVQAQAEVANRKENLIRAQASARDAEDALRRLIMDPSDAAFWQVHLDPIDTPANDNAPVDVDQAIATALSGRYDLSIAQQQLENVDTNIAYFNNQKMPDVRLEGSYRGGGYGGTQLLRSGAFPGTVTGTLNTGFGNVLGQLFSQDFPTWSVGVSVSYPVGQSAEKAQLARAQVQRQQTVQSIESLKLQIVQGVRQAGRQVQSTAERVDAARASQGLAEQRVTVETRRFEAGLSTTFLVTQAQRDLVQAQVDLLQAMLDHQSAVIAYEAVQLAAAPGSDNTIGLNNADVVVMPPATPQGIFRQGGGN
ncbi:MAG TPA: TolC family protein [Vicinamibacterales bacterium]|nr:TolC family protein [Vicinamibacterales bacterium]